jgi:hypothetical protein
MKNNFYISTAMRKKLFKSALALPLFFLSLFLFTGCEQLEDLLPDDKDKTTTYYGPQTQVGEGMARTWVKVSEDAKPLAVGINLSDKAVESLKGKPGEVFVLELPEQGVLTPVRTITLDWNMMGHPEVYFVPHFDIHFYMISEAERLQVEEGPQEHTEEFAANYMPSSYTSGMFSVPQMGVHWEDRSEPQHHEGDFTRTFVYGAYHNEVTFYEPMVAVSYLEQLAPDSKVKMEVAQPAKVQSTGYHPRSYTIGYDAILGEYTIALTDLRYRKAE